jgi:DNA-binding transcriptional regulator GbsR (MarR family)
MVVLALAGATGFGGPGRIGSHDGAGGREGPGGRDGAGGRHSPGGLEGHGGGDGARGSGGSAGGEGAGGGDGSRGSGGLGVPDDRGSTSGSGGSDGLAEARALLVDALGRQSAFWGVGRVTGQLYAVLYLAERPLSLGELAEALRVSKGNVSVAMRSLEALGMVRRSLPAGDRRVFFEAEPDFWLIARRVLERRSKPEFDESFRLVAESALVAAAAQAGSGRDFAVARLAALQAFYGELDAIAAAVLRLDPRRLGRLLRLAGGRRTEGRAAR